MVDSNLCASFDESLHEKVLDVMEGLQVKVIK
jgi:nicotinamidase/pyrazinamidase